MLGEARYVAEKVGGRVTALFCGDAGQDHSDVLRQYGVDHACIFKHPLMKKFSADINALPIAEKLREERPWLFLAGNTARGRELIARLAVLTGSGVVNGCVKMDLENPERPLFYRPAYGGQAWEEIVFQTGGTMLVAMDPAVLNNTPRESQNNIKTTIVEPAADSLINRIRHLAYLPADFRTVDVSEADTIVAAGMGAIDRELLPMVKELAELIEAAIGTTRPVVDEGLIDRERMIGQTGKIVNPEMYLALGISGAGHHLGGIQESGSIISVNRDPGAPIFQNSDLGVVADLKAVLPGLIEKIKQAKKDGTIL